LNQIVGKLAERWVYGQGFTAENKAPQRLPKKPAALAEPEATTTGATDLTKK
jgi:hypothetical protein